MRVPVRRTPQTQISPDRQQYQQAGRGIDLRPLTEPLRAMGQQLRKAQEEADQFDLNRRLVRETNELTADYNARLTQPGAGKEGWTDTVLGDYEKRHEAILQEYWEKGYSQDALNNLELRLGGLRQGVGERAIRFQAETLRSSALGAMEDNVDQLSKMVAADPNSYVSAREENSNAFRDNPFLTDAEREDGRRKAQKILTEIGMRTRAKLDPQGLLRVLDPNNLTAPQELPTAGAYETIEGLPGVAVTVANRYGLDPVEVASVMSFESGGTFDPHKWGGDNNNYQGLIQAGKEERAQFGIDPDLPPEEYAAALIRFFDARGMKPGLGIDDFYSTILTGSPGHYDWKDSNGVSVRNAINGIITGDHRKNAERWLGSVDPGASTAQQAPAVETAEAKPKQLADRLMEVMTDDPLINDADGDLRLRAIEWARAQIKDNSASNRAALDVAVGNAQAVIGSDVTYEGPMPTEEDFVAAYGGVAGAQKYAQFEGALETDKIMKESRGLNPAELNAKVESLRPSGASETLEVETRLYNAAREAQDRILKQRKEDPAAFVMSFHPEIAQALNGTSADRRLAFAKMRQIFDDIGIPENERQFFTNEMLEGLKDSYRKASGAQKLGLIKTMINEMGGYAGTAFGKADSETVQDLELYAFYQGLPNTDGVMKKILEGRDTMVEDPARRPRSDTLQAAFRESLGKSINGLRGEVSARLREAASAIYVADGGFVDDVGMVEKDKWKAAVRQALGGRADNEDTGVVDIDGVPTIMPVGVTGTQFQNWKDGLESGDLGRLAVKQGTRPSYGNGQHIPIDVLLDDGQFVMRQPGVYGILLRNRWVGDGRGGQFTFKLDKPRMGLR